MKPSDMLGVLARALGLYLAVTSLLSLLRIVWEVWGDWGVQASVVVQLLATVFIGLIFLLKGDALARRLYGGAA